MTTFRPAGEPMADPEETTDPDIPDTCPRCLGKFALGECSCGKDEADEDETESE